MAGDIVHFELPAVDPDRAQRFWGGLWGWEFADSGMPGMDYRMARLGDTLGAALAKTEKLQGCRRLHWHRRHRRLACEIRDLGGETEDKSPCPAWAGSACARTPRERLGLWQNDSAAGQ
jgi:predicted enzyme related to lactoylglutathione lyase